MPEFSAPWDSRNSFLTPEWADFFGALKDGYMPGTTPPGTVNKTKPFQVDFAPFIARVRGFEYKLTADSGTVGKSLTIPRLQSSTAARVDLICLAWSFDGSNASITLTSHQGEEYPGTYPVFPQPTQTPTYYEMPLYQVWVAGSGVSQLIPLAYAIGSSPMAYQWADNYDSDYALSAPNEDVESGSNQIMALQQDSWLRWRIAVCASNGSTSGGGSAEIRHRMLITRYGDQSYSIVRAPMLNTPPTDTAWATYSITGDMFLPAGVFSVRVATFVTGSGKPGVHKNRLLGADGKTYSRLAEIYLYQ